MWTASAVSQLVNDFRDITLARVLRWVSIYCLLLLCFQFESRSKWSLLSCQLTLWFGFVRTIKSKPATKSANFPKWHSFKSCNQTRHGACGLLVNLNGTCCLVVSQVFSGIFIKIFIISMHEEFCLKQPYCDTLNFYMTQGHHKDSLKTS